MQVSWIDADEVRDFVAELAEPARRGSTAPDLDTLPEAGDRLGFALLTEDIAALASPPNGEPPPADASAVEAAILPDISQIREKLRAIRERAQEAGLLSKETPAERAAREPGPPVPVAQPVPPAPAAPHASAPDTAAAPDPGPPTTATPSAPETPRVTSSAPLESSEGEPARATGEPDTIVERLNDFARWCASVATSEELFMFDDHGDLIWGAPTTDDLLICARLAMNAGMRSHAATLTAPATSTPIQVAPGKELQLVACPTIYGTVIVALVNAKQVPVAALRERLATTLAMKR